MAIYVGRPVGGISLNGTEWLMESDNETPMTFEDKDKAVAFLRENGYSDYTDEEMEDCFTFTEEEPPM